MPCQKKRLPADIISLYISQDRQELNLTRMIKCVSSEDEKRTRFSMVIKKKRKREEKVEDD